MGRGLANVLLGITQEAIASPIVGKLVLVRGLVTRVIDPLRLRDTRCVPLDRYGLDWMKPGLIVIKGHPGLFAQAKDQKRVPQVHLRIPVMEDGILHNLPTSNGISWIMAKLSRERWAVTSHTFVVGIRREVMK